jgi:hypothetical protein
MVARQVLSLKLVVRFDRPHPFLYERTDFQKTFIRVLLVVCILSVFSVSVFAAGTSSTPAYPSSTYVYVTGISSSGSVNTSSDTYFNAVTQSFKGIGNILSSIWSRLGIIGNNTGYLSAIATDTDSISTINTYVQSSNTWLSNIYTAVGSIKSSLSSSSAWTSNQASTVTSNSTLIETNTKNISNKVATEATLKTLATESTVFSIKSILSDFKTNLNIITTKVSDLADVLASPEDKQLHDNSKSNFDYVNGAFSDNIKNTDKFDVVNGAGSSFSRFFNSGMVASPSDALDVSDGVASLFWTLGIYNEITGQASTSSASASSYSGYSFDAAPAYSEYSFDAASFSDDDASSSSSLPYDPYESYNRIKARFGSWG